MTQRIFGKLTLAAFALLLTMAASTTPTPAAAAGWDIAFAGGLSLPMGDFKDEDVMDARSGPQFGIDIGYHISPTFALGVDGGINKNKHGAEGTTEVVAPGTTLTAEKDKFNTTHFGIHGKYTLASSGKIHPFAVLGLGFYNLKEDYEYILDDGVTQTTFTDESDEADGNIEQPGNRFGWRLGAGFNYMTSETIGLGLDLDYTSVSMDEDEFGGVSSVTWLSIMGRITYHIMK